MALRIKEIIKEKGMTVQTLADKMGINRVGLSNHINGNPSVAILEKIATALEVSIQELLKKKRMKILMDILRLGVKFLKSLPFRIWKICLLVTNSLQNEKNHIANCFMSMYNGAKYDLYN